MKRDALVLPLLGLLLSAYQRRAGGAIVLGGWPVELKPGVKVRGVKPETILGIEIVSEVFRQHPEFGTCVVTSVLDGAHKVGSLHYAGLAFDVRNRHLTEDAKQSLADYCAAALGADYQVLVEGPESTPPVPPHMHVEFDPQ